MTQSPKNGIGGLRKKRVCRHKAVVLLNEPPCPIDIVVDAEGPMTEEGESTAMCIMPGKATKVNTVNVFLQSSYGRLLYRISRMHLATPKRML